ncbi:MATH and LRR domain-containing protein PFE0570w-like isoform X2 [Microplitis mediator]|nr:MATH and LRR domain-containing protein PFE0570w-like isoform X2 [Microplitis mediator]
MEEDIDIYGDLINFNRNECDNCHANISILKSKATELEDLIQVLEKEIENLKGSNTTLKINLSSLLKTAKNEIVRKDRIINELRQQLDNNSFRRNNNRLSNIRKSNDVDTVSKYKNELDEIINVKKEEPIIQIKDTAYCNPINTFITNNESDKQINFDDTPVSTIYGQRLKKKIRQEKIEKLDNEQVRYFTSASITNTDREYDEKSQPVNLGDKENRYSILSSSSKIDEKSSRKITKRSNDTISNSSFDKRTKFNDDHHKDDKYQNKGRFELKSEKTYSTKNSHEKRDKHTHHNRSKDTRLYVHEGHYSSLVNEKSINVSHSKLNSRCQPDAGLNTENKSTNHHNITGQKVENINSFNVGYNVVKIENQVHHKIDRNVSNHHVMNIEHDNNISDKLNKPYTIKYDNSSSYKDTSSESEKKYYAKKQTKSELLPDIQENSNDFCSLTEIKYPKLEFVKNYQMGFKSSNDDQVPRIPKIAPHKSPEWNNIHKYKISTGALSTNINTLDTLNSTHMITGELESTEKKCILKTFVKKSIESVDNFLKEDDIHVTKISENIPDTDRKNLNSPKVGFRNTANSENDVLTQILTEVNKKNIENECLNTEATTINKIVETNTNVSQRVKLNQNSDSGSIEILNNGSEISLNKTEKDFSTKSSFENTSESQTLEKKATIIDEKLEKVLVSSNNKVSVSKLAEKNFNNAPNMNENISNFNGAIETMSDDRTLQLKSSDKKLESMRSLSHVNEQKLSVKIPETLNTLNDNANKMILSDPLKYYCTKTTNSMTPDSNQKKKAIVFCRRRKPIRLTDSSISMIIVVSEDDKTQNPS